jgi:oxygen-independent coproporphyrinogen-3 oxidase
MEPSLYIHIPFCKRKCLYCNFYSCIYESDTASAFIETVTSQLKDLDRDVYSIYVGGGTPTVLDMKLLKELLVNLRRFSIKTGEFTVEANPESLDADKLGLLCDHGVSRLSIGLQSFDDMKLKKLGRIHTSDKAIEALYLAKKTGFDNISADLIFAVWGEDPGSLEAELERISMLPIKHISCYELTYERDAALFEAFVNKSIIPVEDDVAAKMYEMCVDRLGIHGFERYEVSNFAKDGYRSRHNMNYWDNNPYIGLGPSAFSYVDGARSRNVADVGEYINNIRSGKPFMEFREKLLPEQRAKETAAIKIRTKDGIDFTWFMDKTGFNFCDMEKDSIPELLEDGLVEYKKEGNEKIGVVLTPRGFLFCDTVSSTLL